MNTPDKRDMNPQVIRERAETQLAQQKAVGGIPDVEPLRLIHELQVHQIELEMQNEELQLARSTAEVLLDKYTDVYDFAPTGYLTIGSDGSILQLNLKAAQKLGSDRSQLLHKRFQTFIAQDDRRLFNDFLLGVTSSEANHHCEVTLDVRESPPMIVAIEGARVNDSKETRLILIDVTERRRDEKTLKLLMKALDACANSVVITDPSGIVEWTNPAFTALTGYPANEVIGRNMRLLKSGAQGAEFYQKMWRTILAKEVWRGEVINKRKDGSIYTESATITPVLNLAGDVSHFVAVKEDISQRKQWEADLRSLNEELESRVKERTSALQQAKIEADDANLAKSQFLSRVSHELRTPMNAILGFAQILSIRSQDPETKEHLGMILKGGQHLMTLINQLLDLSRLESGRADFHMAPVLLSDVVEQAVELLKPIVNQAEIDVVIEQNTLNGLAVSADRQWLTQVILNLLSNAAKYNRQGGMVRICGKLMPNGKSRIEVSDTGFGFSAEDRKHLFQPFRRFSGKNIEGSGLGLSLSKSYVGLMGGSIGLADSSPSGSTFYVELNTEMAVCPDNKSTSPLPLDSISEPGQALILYIEDDPSSVAVMREILKLTTKYHLISASTGKDGLLMAQDNLPDLILLDNGLPDTSGKEVLAELKANPATRTVPVIIFSGDAMPQTIQELRIAGAADYLTKPVDMGVLLRVLKEQLALNNRGSLM